MSKSIDFYFDFISPYSYLAHKKIEKIREKKEINFNYKPVLLGGLHKLQGITAPAFIKPKLKHMMSDCNLIAKKDGFLIFIEVKTRSSKKFGKPEDAIDKKKISLYKDAAEGYIEQYTTDDEIRFDIVSIIIGKDKTDIEHIPNAF